MSYAALKMTHVVCVIASYLFFTLRGLWMMQASPRLQHRWVKVLPHIIDTLLLTSAVFLAITIHQNPVRDTWLAAKITGLLLYIILGMVALKRGKTRKTRIAAWFAAQIVFFYIVLVALTKNPLLV
jgi:uncharacterized membrane protein SirB2